MSRVSMYRVIMKYLGQLRGAWKLEERRDGSVDRVCLYYPHSIRAATATILLKAGVPIEKVQQLLGHESIETTRGYFKGKIDPEDSASHALPL